MPIDDLGESLHPSKALTSKPGKQFRTLNVAIPPSLQRWLIYCTDIVRCLFVQEAEEHSSLFSAVCSLLQHSLQWNSSKLQRCITDCNIE